MNILEMGAEELLNLNYRQINRALTPGEVIHMALALGAFWRYDYEKARQGKVGMHAILKSKRHSNGFFISRILLAPENIRQIMADQIVRRFLETDRPRPNYVAGIPDGATKLGEDVTWMLGSKLAQMEKQDGRIVFPGPLPDGASLLLVEDFCTRGTGFIEAVRAVLQTCPTAVISSYDPVILNRGGLKEIVVPEAGVFTVLPVVEWLVEDWDQAECPLCKIGSVPIKPKETDENWRAITTSQS